MEKEKVRYLVSVISVIASALIYFIYKTITGGTSVDFFSGVLASAFSTLALFSIIYFFFERHGILVGKDSSKQAGNSLPNETIRLIEEIHSKQANPSVINFYNCWSDVDWRKELQRSSKVEIIVTYWSSWVAEYMDELVALLNRGGSISIVLSSPLDDDCVKQIQKMYPEHTAETMRGKIELTTSRLKAVYRKSRVSDEDFKVFYYPERMNYASVRFDEKRLFLGVYEHFREHKVESPAMLLDLTKSDVLNSFWKRQYTEFNKRSQRVSMHD